MKETPSASWYALYVHVRHEKRVAELLTQRSIDVFLPLYKQVRKWKNGVKASVEFPLFPGYLFTRILRNQQFHVLQVPSALYLVGNGDTPEPISDLEISRLQIGLRELNAEPHPFLKLGQRMTIKSGPLRGVEGILVEVRNRFKCVVSLDLIQRSFAVEVDLTQVEGVPRYHLQTHAVA